MTPEDPRHGKYSGAVQHWFDKEKPCPACTVAEWRYRKTRQLRALAGNPATVPAIGTKRRIEALHALGWARREIADASGLSLHTLHSIFAHGSTRVHSSTAKAITEAYERMSMVVPTGDYAGRNRTKAKNKGWVVPLAWNEGDLDDPNARPHGAANRPRKTDVDPIAVERAMAGDRIQLTRDERYEVVARLRNMGRSLGWIEEHTVITKAERYLARGDAA